MAVLSVSVDEASNRFVEDRVASGEFLSAGEVVGAGLSLLKRRAERDMRKLERLRAAIQVGIDEIDQENFEVIDDLEVWLDTLEGEVNGA
jgi:putative addiction module CopG family antidote